ncbi:MAG: hypothetical protein H0W89_04815 [Candidatus Levybacteria bacterium]|nr:hypothetical protein [Candidatus Levybacteria bacterium]
MPLQKQFGYICYKSSFTSILQVEKHMKDIQRELAGTNLQNLKYFNQTYLIITENVLTATEHHYFHDEKTMEAVDIQFARYYFDALKGYTSGKSITPAWQLTFTFCKENRSIPLIYLALGVNAHVINDLGLALNDVVKDQSFKKDFNRVNKIIFGSITEIMQYCKISKIYSPFMQVLIWHWRKKAWNNFLKVSVKYFTKEVIEKKAYEYAVALTRIYSEKDFYQLSRIIR